MIKTKSVNLIKNSYYLVTVCHSEAANFTGANDINHCFFNSKN